jgi:hypothetical protein
MRNRLVGLGLGVALVFGVLFSQAALAQGVMNFNNSPNNWANSPNNFNNSPNNFGATNGVYDNRGNRIGYEVPAPSGVINYFDNSGNRTGYKPSGR